jgi:hypothetical protein
MPGAQCRGAALLRTGYRPLAALFFAPFLAALFLVAFLAVEVFFADFLAADFFVAFFIAIN